MERKSVTSRRNESFDLCMLHSYNDVGNLMQLRIVYEGMKFPLWLHGHTVITFQVASVHPKNVVGKMIPISVSIVLWYHHMLGLSCKCH